jgi:hypothetical protein
VKHKNSKYKPLCHIHFRMTAQGNFYCQNKRSIWRTSSVTIVMPELEEKDTAGSSSLSNSWREANTLSPLPLPSRSSSRLWWWGCGFFKEPFQSLNVIRKQGRAPTPVGTANSHPHSCLCLYIHWYPGFTFEDGIYKQLLHWIQISTDTKMK